VSDENKPGRGRAPYPPEVRERAVRMVVEHEHEYPSQWKAIESISAKWFRRCGDIPGLNYLRPRGIDASRLPGFGAAPELRVYDFNGKL